MKIRLLLLVAALFSGGTARGQDDADPPILRLQLDGTSKPTTAMQFSADGNTLYVAGWNKVVQVWEYDKARSRFSQNHDRTLRVPLGPGIFGAMQALAVSADEQYVAVGGLGWSGLLPGFRETGYVWPAAGLSDQGQRDIGTIYLFNTQTRAVQSLRAHRGMVRSLRFVGSGKGLRLVSVGSRGMDTQNQEARSWDIETGKPVGQALALPASGLPPTLATWIDREPRVAIGLAEAFTTEGRNSLRIWRMGSQVAQTRQPANILSLAGTRQRGRRQLLVCAISGITLHSVDANGNVGAARRLAGREHGDPLATAVTKHPSRANSQVVSVAVVSGDGNRLSYGMVFADIDQQRVIGPRVPLWTSVERGLVPPVPTASADGRFMALAGRDDHSITVHSVRTLMQGNARPLQTIARRLVPSSAAFVRNGDRSGIHVAFAALAAKDPGGALRSGLVFDLSANRVSTDLKGWQIAAHDPKGWRSAIVNDSEVSVTDPRGRTRRIRVPEMFRQPRTRVTAHLVRPAQGTAPPLLVAAMAYQGMPYLNVYNANNGEYLRQFSGHGRTIDALALSADGRIVLSASDDGSVRGWSLENIENVTIGRIGWLRGLSVINANEVVSVKSVTSGTPAAAAGIRSGDQVLGVVSDQTLEKTTRAAHLYLRASRTLPSANAKLALRMKRGGRVFDVNVRVEQGADDHKPLFSFVIDGTLRDPRWIVWAPTGRYDRSHPEMARRIGWHFNTGDPDKPVRFSTAEQYQRRFYQPGLLETVIRTGKVALVPYIEPTIQLSLVGPNGEVAVPDLHGVGALAEGRGELLAELQDLPNEQVRSIEWRVGDGELLGFEQSGPVLWRARLQQANLARGRHDLKVRVTTQDDPPLEITRSMTLRIQPPPAKISRGTPANPFVTVSEGPDFIFRAELTTVVPVTTTLTHFVEGQQVRQWPADLNESGPIERAVTLQPGRNRFVLVATNRDIPDSLQTAADAETSRLESTVEFREPGPPEVTIAGIRTVDGRPAASSGGITDLAEATIRISGTIKSTGPITDSWISVAGLKQKLDTSESDQGHQFETALTLKPGEQPIEIGATNSKGSDSVRTQVRYRPALPRVRFTQPKTGAVVLTAGGKPQTFSFAAKMFRTNDARFEMKLFVNGREYPGAKIVFDDDAGIARGSLELAPDPERIVDLRNIELRLSNEWNRRRTTSVMARFRHPPIVAGFDVKQLEATPFAQGSLRISTPSNRPLTRLTVTVNDQPVDQTLRQPVDGALVLDRIPLTAGANRITVVAANADGPATAASRVVESRTRPTAPVISIQSPVSDSQLTVGVCQFEALVRSGTPVTKARLVVRRDGRADRTVPLPNDLFENAKAGVRILRDIELGRGVNRLTLEVQNSGGLERATTTVAFLAPPLSIDLKRLVPTEGGAAIFPILRTNSVEFDRPITSGQAELSGRLSWSKGQRPPGKTWMVQLWVNGFLRPIRVTPPEKGTSVEFRLPVVLNRRNNLLRVQAADLPLDEAQRRQVANIRVECSKPERDQNLHLLIVGVDMQDGINKADADKLRKTAERALLSRGDEGAFARIEIERYGPLTGEMATGSTVLATLRYMATRLRDEPGKPNDVVMLYYRGREHRAKDGRIFLEDAENWDDPPAYGSSLSEKNLARFFEDIPGAHLVLLDVDTSDSVKGQTVIQRWPRYPNLGMFRVAWATRPNRLAPEGTLLSMIERAINDAGQSAAAPDVPLRSVETAVRRRYIKPDSELNFDALVPRDLRELIVGRINPLP